MFFCSEDFKATSKAKNKTKQNNKTTQQQNNKTTTRTKLFLPVSKTSHFTNCDL